MIDTHVALSLAGFVFGSLALVGAVWCRIDLDELEKKFRQLDKRRIDLDELERKFKQFDQRMMGR